MAILTKILVNDDSILPLADGTYGKFMVDHASQCMALREKEIAVGAGPDRLCRSRLQSSFRISVRLPGEGALGLSTPEVTRSVPGQNCSRSAR